MKYFYDTEFLEGTQKTLFFRRKETVPTIDLISIGIVAEDGREYYSVSKEFNLKEAWNRYDIKPYEGMKTNNGSPVQRKVYWIRENVLKPIHKQLAEIEGKDELFHEHYDFFSYSSMKYLIKKHGKARKDIANEIQEFVGFAHSFVVSVPHENGGYIGKTLGAPEFYGYYSAYDHVALCWLFGKMMNLPEGFPMYTRDLKQLMDEAAEDLNQQLDIVKQKYINLGVYPKQQNEHRALADARWNKELYNFIYYLKKYETRK